jgi:hypothetical protein
VEGDEDRGRSVSKTPRKARSATGRSQSHGRGKSAGGEDEFPTVSIFIIITLSPY